MNFDRVAEGQPEVAPQYRTLFDRLRAQLQRSPSELMQLSNFKHLPTYVSRGLKQ